MRVTASRLKDWSYQRNNHKIRNVLGPPRELTTEILRLFALDDRSDRLQNAMGVSREEMAATALAGLSEPGGAIFVSDSGRRIEGLLHLAPDLLQSAFLGRYTWSIRNLVLDPSASFDAVTLLVRTSLEKLRVPADRIIASVPATDWRTIQGLRECNFRFIGGEATCVLRKQRFRNWTPRSVAFKQLNRDNIPAAAALLYSHGDPLGLRSNGGFDAHKCRRLYEQLLTICESDPLGGGILVLGSSGSVLGLSAYKSSGLEIPFASRRLAEVSFFSVRPEIQSNGLGELLLKRTMNTLWSSGIDAAAIRTNMDGLDTSYRLRCLHKLGCTESSSNLILQRSYPSHRFLTMDTRHPSVARTATAIS